MRSSTGRVEVWRLQDVGGWELYELVDGPEGDALCTIATRHYQGLGQVEYGVWLPDRSEPELTASLEGAEGEEQWSDAERQSALTSIVYKHFEGLHECTLQWYLDSREIQALADQHA